LVETHGAQPTDFFAHLKVAGLDLALILTVGHLQKSWSGFSKSQPQPELHQIFTLGKTGNVASSVSSVLALARPSARADDSPADRARRGRRDRGPLGRGLPDIREDPAGRRAQPRRPAPQGRSLLRPVLWWAHPGSQRVPRLVRPQDLHATMGRGGAEQGLVLSLSCHLIPEACPFPRVAIMMTTRHRGRGQPPQQRTAAQGRVDLMEDIKGGKFAVKWPPYPDQRWPVPCQGAHECFTFPPKGILWHEEHYALAARASCHTIRQVRGNYALRVDSSSQLKPCAPSPGSFVRKVRAALLLRSILRIMRVRL